MRTYRSLMMVVVAAAVCVAAAGCGSSSKSNSTGSAAVATTPTTTATTAAPATTTTIDETAAKAAITTAFVSFLNSADPNFDARVALIQNGDSIKALFTQLEQANSKVASYGKVTDITLMSADDCSANGYNSACAAVTYDIYLKSNTSKPALAGSKGYAVLDNGTWKVSRSTFCTLAGLANVQCPAS
jgi:hypothetical protein